MSDYGVKPCPVCGEIPKAFDYSGSGMGFTIACMNEGCDYYFISKARTLCNALLIWNKKASKQGRRK